VTGRIVETRIDDAVAVMTAQPTGRLTVTHRPLVRSVVHPTCT
jgi:hypothetical protein